MYFYQSLVSLTVLAQCCSAFCQEPTAQECLDRALVTLTANSQKCILYSEMSITSSKPNIVKASSRDFVRVINEFEDAPQELLLLKEHVDDMEGNSHIVETLLLKQGGETRFGQFVGEGDASLLGLVPSEHANADPEMARVRTRLDTLVFDARHALLLPMFYQRTNQVSIPLVTRSYNGQLVHERASEREIVGVWQFDVSKVEICFSKLHAWLPSRLRWFKSKSHQTLARSDDDEIIEPPTYENEVSWRNVENTWIPVFVRYTMGRFAYGNPKLGKGSSSEIVQHSMYRFKAVENLGPVHGFFEEMRSGGPFQKIILEMAAELMEIQTAKK